jgi:hypothetical protein
LCWHRRHISAEFCIFAGEHQQQLLLTPSLDRSSPNSLTKVQRQKTIKMSEYDVAADLQLVYFNILEPHFNCKSGCIDDGPL